VTVAGIRHRLAAAALLLAAASAGSEDRGNRDATPAPPPPARIDRIDWPEREEASESRSKSSIE
jgi:hypothetical protein